MKGKYQVLLTEGAERDLEDIHEHIAENDSVAHADQVLERLMELVEALSEFPERGSQPKELAGIGIKEYRQVLFKPYRVLYRTIGQRVVIFLIVDGRRDMQSLLARRLLG